MPPPPPPQIAPPGSPPPPPNAPPLSLGAFGPLLLGGGVACKSEETPPPPMAKAVANAKMSLDMPAMPSRWPKRGRNCYLTPAFSGVPDAKRGEKIRVGYLTDVFLGAQKGTELLRNRCVLKVPQSKGHKIIIGYLTPTISGAQKGTELLRDPCILGGLQRQVRGPNWSWLPHPCLLGGPEGDGSAA